MVKETKNKKIKMIIITKDFNERFSTKSLNNSFNKFNINLVESRRD